ncbi:inositol monophosphatase family protein [Pseudarthrobacter sp. J75]|uniref:inositol monophosphatase family protein n=1 Tax=unclassified Pseudarthrobacter TaxID=2647000 RepID=UPI002E805614|nr:MULTISPECIES: inositol monophosphatase family protein [unclassified Pseudarthrobacter]MEE2521711.1 inositol monophosphatase family protein [Pseudarthrobacter sp. J47]MEE2527788.1 inositol monophosphatase family protein [Pseudarthrobacter sp. J75]MEE2569356.1 inositol monophosphatase family protein [Pseudarthrobacter sp. J64]
MSVSTPDALLNVAREAARAGATVLAGRSTATLELTNKGEAGDWVTDFDVAAEHAVRGVITQRRPSDAITGEEHGTTRPENGSGYRWSIDPLDGTTNFIRNIVYYATSVAVADANGGWLAGVVDAPALGRTYYASRGGGAWLEEGGVRTRLTGPQPGRKGQILATGFSYDPAVRAEQAAVLGGLMDGFADVRRLGSAALDLCLVADGTHDAYGERGLNEHDFAAGALIAEEAGCWVRRPLLASPLDGGPEDRHRLAAWTCAATLELSGKFPL